MIVSTFFSLPTLYQFQIKEYFLPRILSGIKDNRGFWIPLKMPARSLRNILITGFVFLIMVAYFGWTALRFQEIDLSYTLFWGLGFLASKVVVFLGVLLTEPLALYKRGRIIKRAEQMAKDSDAVVIGVTGSYGKSSMKVILHRLLSEKYKVASTKKNYNSEVGVAMSFLNEIRPDTQYFISEMAAYTVGTITRSANITPPRIGFVTGLGNQHVDIFGSREALLKAKSELPSALPKDGKLYLNMDCDGYEVMTKAAHCTVITYSITNPKADAYSQPTGNGSFHFAYKNLNLSLNTVLPGNHSILNLTGALACAIDLGLDEKQIVEALKHLKPISQKLSRRELDNGSILIDDSYNSSVEGFIAALHYISEFSQTNRTAITRGLLELGDTLETSYERIVSVLRELNIHLITTDPVLHKIAGDEISELVDEKSVHEKICSGTEKDVFLLEGRFSPKVMQDLSHHCRK